MSEPYKFDWPLTPDSLVLDIGCFEGNWAAEIARRYDCEIYAFEPIREFFDKAHQRLKDFPKVLLYPMGVDDKGGQVPMRVTNDSTGAFNRNPEGRDELADMVSLAEVMESTGDCDLLKLNCEGGEFAILEYILKHGWNNRFKGILVQPHTVVPDCLARWQAIEEGLLKTHVLTFNCPWVWQRYELI